MMYSAYIHFVIGSASPVALSLGTAFGVLLFTTVIGVLVVIIVIIFKKSKLYLITNYCSPSVVNLNHIGTRTSHIRELA